MGTRADFYVGRGPRAEWLGSVAWDGYPEGFDKALFRKKTARAWRLAVSRLIDERDDGTTPEMGWPWPWDDSGTTDYAYAYEKGRVWASCFGRAWFNPLKREPEHDGPGVATFPNMKAKQRVTYGKRSGVIVVGLKE